MKGSKDIESVISIFIKIRFSIWLKTVDDVSYNGS